MKKRNKIFAALLAALLLSAFAAPAAFAAPGRSPGDAGTAVPGEPFSFTGTGSGLTLTSAPNETANGSYEVRPAAGAPEIENAQITVTADPADEGSQQLTLSGILPAGTQAGHYTYQIGFRLRGASFVIPVTTFTIAVAAEPAPSATAEPSSEPSAVPSHSSAPGVSMPPYNPGPPTYDPAPGHTTLPSAGASSSASSSADPSASQTPVQPVPDLDGPLKDLVISDLPGFGAILSGIPISSASSVCRAADLAASLQVPEGYTLAVQAADGSMLPEDASLATGCRALLLNTSGSAFWQAQIVVSGDVLGNGTISIAQVVRIAQALNGSRPLEGLYLQAGLLTSGSSQITIADVVKVAQMLSSQE